MMHEGEPTNQVKGITTQYRQVVGALEEMFAVAKPRTNTDSWRRDGVGSCRQPDKALSELWLDGPARSHIISLRDDRNREVEGSSTHSGCPYHRDDRGCTLTDVNLKSPLCISFIENPSEWKRRFGIDTYALTRDIRDILRSVQEGETLGDTTPIDVFTADIHALTEKIQQEPRLEGGTRREKITLFWRKIKGMPRRIRNQWVWRHM